MRPSVLPGVTWHTVSPPSVIKAAGKDSTSKCSTATKSSIVWGQLPGLSTRQCQGREMMGRMIEKYLRMLPEAKTLKDDGSA